MEKNIRGIIIWERIVTGIIVTGKIVSGKNCLWKNCRGRIVRLPLLYTHFQETNRSKKILNNSIHEMD